MWFESAQFAIKYTHMRLLFMMLLCIQCSGQTYEQRVQLYNDSLKAYNAWSKVWANAAEVLPKIKEHDPFVQTADRMALISRRENGRVLLIRRVFRVPDGCDCWGPQKYKDERVDVYISTLKLPTKPKPPVVAVKPRPKAKPKNVPAIVAQPACTEKVTEWWYKHGSYVRFDSLKREVK